MEKLKEWHKIIDQLAKLSSLPEADLSENSPEYSKLHTLIESFEAHYGRSLETLLCLIDISLSKDLVVELLEQAWHLAESCDQRKEVLQSYTDCLAFFQSVMELEFMRQWTIRMYKH
jgi:hypothetical protein